MGGRRRGRTNFTDFNIFGATALEENSRHAGSVFGDNIGRNYIQFTTLMTKLVLVEYELLFFVLGGLPF